MTKTHLAHLAMLAVALFYAFNYFVTPYIFQTLSPFALLALRSLTAILVFVPMAYFSGKFVFPDKEDLPRILFCAFTGIVINQAFFLWGLKLTFPINSAVLMVCSPIFVFLVAWLIKATDETFSQRRMVGLSLSFLGAVLLIANGSKLAFGANTVMGDIMTLINAISYSVYLVFIKPIVNKYSMLNLFAWIFIFGGSVNILIGLPYLLETDFVHQPIQLYLSILYVCIFATVLAYSLNAWAMRFVPSSYVGMYVYLQPALVTMLSLFFYQKSLSWEKMAYILIIFVGVFLTTQKKLPNNVS